MSSGNCGAGSLVEGSLTFSWWQRSPLLGCAVGVSAGLQPISARTGSIARPPQAGETCKLCKLLHLWNQTLSLCTVAAAAVVIKLTLTPVTGYIYEIILFISDSCRKALITVQRRLINLSHKKHFHPAAVKHVAAGLVAPDKQTWWLSRPVVMCYWENRKRKDRNPERNRKALEHKTRALCVFIRLLAQPLQHLLQQRDNISVFHPPPDGRKTSSFIAQKRVICWCTFSPHVEKRTRKCRSVSAKKDKVLFPFSQCCQECYTKSSPKSLTEQIWTLRRLHQITRLSRPALLLG